MRDIRDLITCLKVGEENATTHKDLCAYGFEDSSKIRSEIHRLRCKGIPVCSSKRGYYIASNYADLQHTIKNLASRRNSLDEVISALVRISRGFDTKDEQMTWKETEDDR